MEHFSILYGFSYGNTGQRVEFKKNGKMKSGTEVYVDNILASDPITGVYDFSNISVDLIDKIVIDDFAADASGVRIDITTRHLKPTDPLTEVLYKAAYFNHRDLSFLMGQNYNKDVCWQLFADITDFKDIRDSDEFYDLPYEKQDYNFKSSFPVIFGIKPSLDLGYFRKKQHDYAIDSTLFLNEIYNFSFRGDLDSLNLGAKESFIFAFQKNVYGLDNRYKANNYDRFNFTNLFSCKTGVFQINNDTQFNFNDFYFDDFDDEKIVNNKFKIGMTEDKFSSSINYFIQNSSLYGTSNSVGLDFRYDFSNSIFIENYNKYYNGFEKSYNASFQLPDTIKSSFVNNQLILNKQFKMNQFAGTFHFGTEYQKVMKFSMKGNLAEIDKNEFGEGENILLLSGFKLNISDRFNINSDFTYRMSSDFFIYNPKVSLITSIDYSNSFFKDELKLYSRLSHKFSEYYTGKGANKLQRVNNIDFSINLQILDLEFFYGIKNLLKDHYDLFYKKENRIYVNDYYRYETIDSHKMSPVDEIIGIRWVFYN